MAKGILKEFFKFPLILSIGLVTSQHQQLSWSCDLN